MGQMSRYRVESTVRRVQVTYVAAFDEDDARKRVKRMHGVVKILNVKKEK